MCSNQRFATPSPRSRRETIGDVTETTRLALKENQRDVTPLLRNDRLETTPPPRPRANLNQRYVTPPPRNDRSETTPPPLPRADLNQMDVTPTPRNGRSETTPPPRTRAGLNFNDVWPSTRNDHSETTPLPLPSLNQRDATPPPRNDRSRTTRLPQPRTDMVQNEVWHNFEGWNPPETEDQLTSLKKWEAPDPVSVSLFYQILKRIDPAPPMSVYIARGISGHTVQVELPDGITASFLRGPLAEMINSQRFAEDLGADKVLPYQVRLYDDLMELNYSEPAPMKVSMLIDPPVDPLEEIFQMFGSFAPTYQVGVRYDIDAFPSSTIS